MALLKAREVVMSEFRPMLAEHDVSEQQWRVLRALNEVRFLDATQLADKASILAPSLTRIIKTLEARKLIQSGRFDRDARKVLISITPLGEQLIHDILPQSRAVYARIDETFGREKVEQLLNLLEQLIDSAADFSEKTETVDIVVSNLDI